MLGEINTISDKKKHFARNVTTGKSAVDALMHVKNDFEFIIKKKYT